jgi:hypothetical protein
VVVGGYEEVAGYLVDVEVGAGDAEVCLEGEGGGWLGRGEEAGEGAEERAGGRAGAGAAVGVATAAGFAVVMVGRVGAGGAEGREQGFREGGDLVCKELVLQLVFGLDLAAAA